MKKLIVILVAVLLTTAAIPESTQAKKNVLCDDTKTMFNELVNGEYAERPVWGGDGENSQFVLLINKKTGTWTFIEFVKDRSCVLGVGEGSLILDLEKKTTHSGAI
jgi:hypothetical protein